MSKSTKIVCIIPARLRASRFPGKMLTSIAGKPVLQWVWEAARTVAQFDKILFAIDAPEIAMVIKDFGGDYIMTSEQCACGTDRLVEIMKSGAITADVWVNWQGDEPFITADMITNLLQTCGQDLADVWTLKKHITNKEQIFSANVAKVVCDINGYALYFSRSPIPFYRDLVLEDQSFYKAVGLYAFTTQALEKISEMQCTHLENAEKLEQLRWLQHGLSIRVHETDREVRGIDTPEDLEHAQVYARANKK